MNNDDNRIQCPTCKTTYNKIFLIGKQGHADSCPMCGASLEEDRSDWITWWYYKSKKHNDYSLWDKPPLHPEHYELIQEFKAPLHAVILTNLLKSRKSSAPTFQTLSTMTLSLRRQKRPAVPGAPAPTFRLFPRATALWALAPVIPPGYVPTADMNYNLTTFSLRETMPSLFFCIIGNSFGFPIIQKTLRAGCAARGDDIYCYAIPRAKNACNAFFFTQSPYKINFERRTNISAVAG